MARTKFNPPATSKSSNTAKDASIKARSRATSSLPKKAKPKASPSGKTQTAKIEASSSDATSKQKINTSKKKSSTLSSSCSSIQTTYFWKETDEVTGFLSPWYQSPFEEDGVSYQSVGQYIMAGKARLFKDKKTLDKILASKSADEHKSLGNSVKGFNRAMWEEHAYGIATRAQDNKFIHGPSSKALQKRLLPFVDHQLVFASPTDHYFGIGFTAEEAATTSRKRWGQNFLGHAFHNCKHRTKYLDDPERYDREHPIVVWDYQ